MNRIRRTLADPAASTREVRWRADHGLAVTLPERCGHSMRFVSEVRTAALIGWLDSR